MGVAEMSVTPGKWVGMGWQIFKQDAGNFVLITLVALGLAAVGNFVVAGPLLAGQFIAARRRMLEGRTDLMDLFAGIYLYVHALLIYILTTIFELFSRALCIVPIVM